MIYGSVCSGIEAASVAWQPLGWKAAFLSEIEAFPRAVLAHHYPETPLHGDFTNIASLQYDPIDLLVGGTPCQSFSVAGLRGGLDDDRGNLALEYLRLADRLRPRWLVWENVPGVFSAASHVAPDLRPPDIDLDTGDGPADGEEVVVEDSYDADESHAFSCILAGFSELGYGFAYRVFDAQYFRVAQRRRRVFVVGYLGDWRRAAAVLFERHSLSGHPAPSREAWQSPASSLAGGARERGGYSHDEIPLTAAYGGGNRSGAIPVAAALAAHGRRQDFEVETFVATAYRTAGDGCVYEEGDCTAPITTGTDSSASIVAWPLNANALRGDTHAKTPSLDAAGVARLRDPGLGIGNDGDPADTLQAAGPGAVAFALRGRDGGAMPEVEGDGDRAGALRAASGGSSRDYVAFNITPSNSNRDYNARPSDRTQALTAGGNRPSARGGDLIAGPAVRRLTPRECERLQGFPDDYTLIPWRKGLAPDGPRYKALGNSMAVPVMAWIGRRIEAVEALTTTVEPREAA